MERYNCHLAFGACLYLLLCLLGLASPHQYFKGRIRWGKNVKLTTYYFNNINQKSSYFKKRIICNNGNNRNKSHKSDPDKAAPKQHNISQINNSHTWIIRDKLHSKGKRAKSEWLIQFMHVILCWFVHLYLIVWRWLVPHATGQSWLNVQVNSGFMLL